MDSKKSLLEYDAMVEAAYQVSKQHASVAINSDLRWNFESKIRSLGIPGTVHYFGSRLMGTSTECSDLDIFVDFGHRFYADLDVNNDLTRVLKIRNAFRCDPDWREIEMVSRFRLPLFKVLFLRANIECDISVSNGMGVRNSQMFQHLFSIQPEAARLYHFIHILLTEKNFTFKNFLLTLMVIFYLQQNNLIPSIARIQKNIPQRTIEGFDAEFDSNKTLADYGVREMDDYKNYIAGFFEFYANFDYSNVISTHYGITIPALKYIQSKSVGGYGFSNFRASSPFRITGLINQGYNAGYYISRYELEDYKRKCKESYIIMQQINT